MDEVRIQENNRIRYQEHRAPDPPTGIRMSLTLTLVIPGIKEKEKMLPQRRFSLFTKKKLYTTILLLVFLGIVLSGCFPFRLPVDYAYSLCTSANGMVVDSLTRDPLKGVSVKVYRHEHVRYIDSTDSMGTYRCEAIKLKFVSSPERLRELETKPPMRKELELRLVFEKSGYRKFELLVPIQFVYCSPHPQPAEIPEVKMPDVFLVPE